AVDGGILANRLSRARERVHERAVVAPLDRGDGDGGDVSRGLDPDERHVLPRVCSRWARERPTNTQCRNRSGLRAPGKPPAWNPRASEPLDGVSDGWEYGQRTGASLIGARSGAAHGSGTGRTFGDRHWREPWHRPCDR